MGAHKFNEILKLESKCRHLDNFSDNPDKVTKDALVLFAFGLAHEGTSKDEACSTRAIQYYERAKERIDANVIDQRPNKKSDRNQIKLNSGIGINLAGLYSEGRDAEKAISTYRWFLANGNRDEVPASDFIRLSHNFNRCDKFEYTIEVLEGSMDMMETLEEKVQADSIMYLIHAYIGCGEFLKAKAADKKRRSRNIHDWTAVGLQSARIEEGLCNYKAAITHSREAVVDLQKQENGSPNESTFLYSVSFATLLLKDSAANEAEAFAIFHEELDRCVDPIPKEIILLQIGTWYRKLHKWEQSIESLHQLSCLSATRPDSAMLPQANQAMAQTYLEQYCTDTTLTIDQQTEILCHANTCSNQVDECSTKMHLTQAQLFYFNVDKQQAYHHLELYLDARLAACKLTCYTCKQRVRPGSVPFTCASCGVASYCDRRHQKMTWKNERICHRVLCPLLGYWRVSKKKQKKRHGFTNEDRRKCEKVFDTFFESIRICLHVKLPASNPSAYTMKN